jgi:hypothetical protein
MKRKLHCACLLLTGLIVAIGSSASYAQRPAAAKTAGSNAELAMQAAAEQGKFAFLLFHRTDDAATSQMAEQLTQGVGGRQDQALMAYVNVAEPAEKAIIEKLGVSRTPLPLTLAIAPNGAITGVFVQKLGAASVDQAIVSPAMMASMKSLQEGKIVVVCVHESREVGVPGAVTQIKKDPHYANRTTTVSLLAADPAEAKFLSNMKIKAAAVQGVTMVVLAPPGVLVDKFDATATGSQISAALAKAGKCCDDENCKHNQQHKSTQAETSKARR